MDNPSKTIPIRWVMVIIVFFVWFARFISWYAPGPLLTTLMKEFSINYSQAGTLMSIISFMAAIFIFLGSFFIDRFGPKRALLYALCIICLGSLIVTVSKSYAVLLAGRLITGIGIGMSSPLAATFFTMWLRPGEKPVANTLNVIVMYGATATVYLICIPIFMAVGAWQFSLGLFGLFALFMTLIVGFFLKNNNEVFSAIPQSDNSNINKRQSGIVLAFKRKEIKLLALTTTCAMWTYATFNTYLPAYFQNVRGMTIAEASYMTAFAPIIGVAGALVVGSLMIFSGLRKVWLILEYSLVFIGAVGILTVPTGPWLYVCVGLMGFAYAETGIVFNTIPMELKGSTPQLVGGAVAVANGSAQLVFFLVTLGFNSLVVHWSLATALAIYTVPCALAIICAFFIPETGPGFKGRRLQKETSNISLENH